jgi:hypothetical protein
MAETSSCLNNRCFTVTEGNVAHCPACGAPTMSSRQVRVRGWVLIAVGLFLAVFMGVVLWFIAPMMLRPLPEGSDDAAAIPFVFALCGGLIACGLAAAVNGVLQVRTGRRNRRGLTVMLAIIAITMLAAWIGVGLLGGGVRGPVPVRL